MAQCFNSTITCRMADSQTFQEKVKIIHIEVLDDLDRAMRDTKKFHTLPVIPRMTFSAACHMGELNEKVHNKVHCCGSLACNGRYGRHGSRC